MISLRGHPPSSAIETCLGHLVCVLGLLLLSACAIPGASVKNRVALVIGNSAYTSVPVLKNPANDAEGVCKALEEVGFQAKCPTQVATKKDFEDHVKNYVASLGPNSVGVFYYSGHGVQVAGQNYLVPTSARVNSPEENPLPQLYRLSDLFDALRQKPTAFQMVVLDACRTDPFAAPTSGRGDTRNAPDATTRAAFVKSLEVVARASYGTAAINDAPLGTIVLFATASKDTAYDGVGNNGPLTTHFLSNVKTRGLTVEDLIKKVVSGVQDETKRVFGAQRMQTPYHYGSFRNKFCFAGCFEGDGFNVPPTP